MIFIVGEHTPDERVSAQSRKQIGGHLGRGNTLGVARAGEVVAAAVVDANFFEDVILVAPIREIWIRNRHLVHHPAALVQKQQSISLVVRQRPQQHGIYYAKDCCVGADAQGEGKYDDDAHAWTLE